MRGVVEAAVLDKRGCRPGMWPDQKGEGQKNSNGSIYSAQRH